MDIIKGWKKEVNVNIDIIHAVWPTGRYIENLTIENLTKLYADMQMVCLYITPFWGKKQTGTIKKKTS